MTTMQPITEDTWYAMAFTHGELETIANAIDSYEDSVVASNMDDPYYQREDKLLTSASVKIQSMLKETA